MILQHDNSHPLFFFSIFLFSPPKRFRVVLIVTGCARCLLFRLPQHEPASQPASPPHNGQEERKEKKGGSKSVGFCFVVWANGQMGEWANEQMGKWANRQLGNWANGQISKRKAEWPAKAELNTSFPCFGWWQVFFSLIAST